MEQSLNLIKQPFQFRYYSGLNKKPNYPADLTENDLVDGRLFTNYNFIYSVGIQTTPGVQFTLNDGKNWIEVGDTGIYELDLTGIGQITSIAFNNHSPGWGVSVEKNKPFFVLVDIIYQTDQKPTDKIPSL